MRCIGKTCCKLYKDKTKCKKATERENNNGICNCRHARYLCEVKECLFQHARGSLNCSLSFPSDLIGECPSKYDRESMSCKVVNWEKLFEEYITQQAIEHCLSKNTIGHLHCSPPFPSVKDTIYHQAFVDATLALNTDDYIDPFLRKIYNPYNEN